MRISEILRSLVDVIDRIESDQAVEDPNQEYKDRANDDVARFNQVKDLIPSGVDVRVHANEPEEAYASVASVTTDAGGGPNGPKHPSDIRSSSTSMYPGTTYGAQ